MNKIITSIAAALLACTALSAQEWKPADPEATPEAVELFSRLVRIADKGIMYGHQDDLVTGSTWRAEYGRSDTKEAVGDYPAGAPRRMDPNALIKTLKKNNRYLFLQDIQKIK